MAYNWRNVEVNLPEAEKIPLQKKIQDYLNSGKGTALVLTGLSNTQRKYLHSHAAKNGLRSKSYGNKHNRELHISRVKKQLSFGDAHKLTFGSETRRVLAEIVPNLKLQQSNSSLPKSSASSREQQMSWRNKVRQNLLLGLGSRMVPPRSNRISNELFRDKMELPIFKYQDTIRQYLQNNSVFIVNGETGSGKTTQVPQYILNDSCRMNRPCRILVTQPRRVAAVSVAHRVAEERGEPLGETVGYQIRMESRVRKTTNLIYTTSGCLLRAIMADVNDLFRKVTHLIIDEIHERDKYTDFTLIAIKEQLKINKDLKVVLMSATMDIHLLSTYFDDCPIMNVPGQGYDVKLYHLEDILYHTGYRTLLMEKYLRLMPNGVNEWEQTNNKSNGYASAATPVIIVDECAQEIIDKTIDRCCSSTPDDMSEYFDQLLYFIESEGVPIDAGHSQNGKTPLIAACQCNCPKYVAKFMKLNANPNIKDILGYTALDYAISYPDLICFNLLNNPGHSNSMNSTQVQLQDEKDRILCAYQQQFNDDNDVDHDLILSLLEGLYRSKHPGAIMVFLPGYNDIVTQRDLITSTLPAGTYKICILHGQMDSNDQWQALQPLRVRKIILSTNIGQTSITIPDLVYIIDSGKVKMKTYDSVTESSQLQSVWISQADANQRSGRAGRTQNGVCYRLYSKAKYDFMSKFCFPEFMRIPLTEICLYAKTLDAKSPVEKFLSRALNPPLPECVQNSVRKLQILQVFDEQERVTDLGTHLVEIPLDVQLGKCLLYSIFLKCFEPILTIVAFHSVKDPFILPTDRSIQGHASFQRKSFAGNSFSDQKGILNLYESYMALRHNKKKLNDFCNKYFLSASGMDMFVATRRQISDLISQKFRISANTNTNSNDWNMIRMCLVAGFYPNVAMIERTKMTLISGAEKQLIVQRTSSLNPPGMKNLKEFADKLPYDWIVFYEKSRLSQMCSINMNTVIPPVIIALLCGKDHLFESDDLDNETSEEDDEQPGVSSCIKNGSRDDNDAVCDDGCYILALDNWIKFEMTSNDGKHLIALREFLHTQFFEFLRRGHSKQVSDAAAYVQRVLNTFPE